MSVDDLREAVMDGKEEETNRLLDQGVDVNGKDKVRGSYLLLTVVG